MTASAQSVLAELKALGKESFRKTYRRHGAGDDVYGVSTADLKALQKKIKVDQTIAAGLWASGNYDARILAAMVADPEKAERATLDAWVRDLDNYPITAAFAGLAAATPHARWLAETWMKSKQEYVSSTGWQIVAHLAMKDRSLDDAYFAERLEIIRRDIAKAPNRTRHNMNGALIAIGSRNAALEAKALAVARAIGKVEVDHGETGCTTPDAARYIAKIKARKK